MQPYWGYKTPNWVIFDLDGTLADITHRLNLISGDSPDWDSFNLECFKDAPKNHVIELLKMCKHYGKSIAIFSGRNEMSKQMTIDWLKRHDIKWDILEMRGAKDFRSDVDVKRDMFVKYFDKKNIWFVVDDRDKVVNLWRELGLTCFQCQKGDY